LAIDRTFRDTGRLAYTSSILATDSFLPEPVYTVVDEFDRGKNSDVVQGAYDTNYESFNSILVDDSILSDMGLALASAAITMTAVLLHTRSLWLTLVGFLQITLSFPLAFFLYRFVGGLTFFPFLNFIGVFIVFALGADDIFVAVDKWKNARLDLTAAADKTEVALKALPDAAHAMLLTTLTTAVAFFATAVCPVAPIRCFAIFCGLLITLDYILCCAFLFPALCIYDDYTNNKNKINCCCAFSRRKVVEEEQGHKDQVADRNVGDDAHDDDVLYDDHNIDNDEQQSLIRRILSFYHRFIHEFKTPLFIVLFTVFGCALYTTTQFQLPNSADVRLLRESNQFEKSYSWRQELLFTELTRRGGSSARLVFGLTPADTGNHFDPESHSQLVLNNNFDPSKTEAQLYLRDICKKLEAEEFATRVDGELCPFEKLDAWLAKESSGNSTSSGGYSMYCGNATGIPIREELFHGCATQYALENLDSNFFLKGSVVKAVDINFGTQVSWLSSFEELGDNWSLLEGFVQREIAESAPDSATDFFFINQDFWLYDTNAQLLSAAYIAAAIALGVSAAVVLISSRSLILTLFSAFSIAFVLVTVVACLVFLGWTLGL